MRSDVFRCVDGWLRAEITKLRPRSEDDDTEVKQAVRLKLQEALTELYKCGGEQCEA